MKTATDDDAKASRIRALNDALRTTCVGGAVVCTSGFAALPEATRQRFMFAMRDFQNFTADNDPHGEHDFGAIDIDREKIFFKIEYYDRDMTLASPDPSDPTLTTRVMTIMLAHEY